MSHEHLGRRVKCVNIGENDILCLFCGIQENRQYISFPLIAGLPEGYRILSVAYDRNRQCFQFKVEHPSFEVVEPGALMPCWNPWHLERVETREVMLKPFPEEPAAQGVTPNGIEWAFYPCEPYTLVDEPKVEASLQKAMQRIFEQTVPLPNSSDAEDDADTPHVVSEEE